MGVAVPITLVVRLTMGTPPGGRTTSGGMPPL
jgi:hypothetical protein